MDINEFKPGDRLIITSRNRQGEERRAAVVTIVNYNGNGLVTYSGDYREGFLPTGSGAFDPAKVGTTPFGFYTKVEKAGYSAPWRPWSPAPGNRGYDLMC